jgi:hypothetical protein
MLGYWLLQTVALAVAAVDLVRSPFEWRKTEHGLADRPRTWHAERPAPVRTIRWGGDVVSPPPANSAHPQTAARRE